MDVDTYIQLMIVMIMMHTDYIRVYFDPTPQIRRPVGILQRLLSCFRVPIWTSLFRVQGLGLGFKVQRLGSRLSG